MSTNPEVQVRTFNQIPLTEPLDAEFLDSLSLDETTRLKQNLIKRAADVIGEISALKASSDFEAEQYTARLFRAEIEDCGMILFRHELDRKTDPIKNERNFFVPGTWFQKYMDELEQLREEKAAYVAQFPEHKKQKLINQLLSGVVAPSA